MMTRFVILALLLTLTAPKAIAETNPPAEGFNQSGSDPKAIEIADAVMKKLGGWKNWNQTRYITWRFFGRRLHVWDKWTGNLRHEDEDLLILMNINTRKGRVWFGGTEQTNPDSIKKYVTRGYRRWINDSYWLVMPYKLKDTGVTLKYSGEDKTTDDRPAHKLTLTFHNTGVTPQNKYDVWVDQEHNLVTEWAFYRKAADAEPQFRNPWTNWTNHGNILLSAGRGATRRGERKHTDIAVFDVLPASVFEKPDPVDLMALKGSM